ncbi:MAG: hypothetical protein NTX22_03870 [Ignavibacteriales bacterium]|nr:hypothetical protein [Ignavibacteriales bacterium]
MKKLLFILIIISGISLSQTISFDEFVETNKTVLDKKPLLEVKDNLPDDIILTGADIGDFSGDGKNDFALAYKIKNSRNKVIYISLYCDSLSHYIPIFSDALEYFELPIEIAFSIAKNICYVTQKLEEKSWKITGYSFYKNEFSLVDKYITEVKKLNKKFQIGEENYSNYSNLNSFVGYFDLNSIEQFKKTSFYIMPVYDLERNIYKGFKRKIIIDDSWKWKDSSNGNKYGEVFFAKDKDRLILDFRLYKSTLEKLDPNKNNFVEFYFDRSKEKILEKVSAGLIKKIPKFRSTIDENIFNLTFTFNLKQANLFRLESNIGKTYNISYKDKIKFDSDLDSSFHTRISIPIAIFNLPAGEKYLNNFILLNFALKDGNNLFLQNSDGSETDPSSYSRLEFIGNDYYYGLIKNNKFKLLMEQMIENAVVQKND